VILWVVVLYVGLSPWTSPMHAVAGLGLPAAQTVHALLILAGFVLPALFLIRSLAALPAPASQA
jgi:hypothetical protein